MKKKKYIKRAASILMAAVIGTGTVPFYIPAGAEMEAADTFSYDNEQTIEQENLTGTSEEIMPEDKNSTEFSTENSTENNTENNKASGFTDSNEDYFMEADFDEADDSIETEEDYVSTENRYEAQNLSYEDGGDENEEDWEETEAGEDHAEDIFVLSASCGEMTLTLQNENGEAFPKGTELYLLSPDDALRNYGDPSFDTTAWIHYLQKQWEENAGEKTGGEVGDHEEIHEETPRAEVDQILAYYVLLIDEDGRELWPDHVKYEFALENRDFAYGYTENPENCAIGCHNAQKQYILSKVLRDIQILPWEDGSGISFCGTTDRFGWFSFIRKESNEMVQDCAEGKLLSEEAYNSGEEESNIIDEPENLVVEETDEDSEEVDEDPVPNKFKLVIKGVSTAPGVLMNGGATTTNKSITFYETDGSTSKQIAYCLQPKALSPSSGHTYAKEDTQVLNEGTEAEQQLTKGMFYLYGGPAWGKTVGYMDHSESVNLQEVMITAGCKTTAHYYAMTHYILSYIYMNGSNWNYNGSDSNVLNSKGVALVKTIAEQLRKLPMPQAGLSLQKITASYSKEDQANISESVTYQAFDDNTARITLPDGVSLVNETTGIRESGTVLINGGDTFHLEASGQTTGLKTYTLSCSYSNDFTAMKLKLSGKQDIGFSYYSGDYDLQLKVKWPEMVRIAIHKKDALCAENYVSASNLQLSDAVYGIFHDIECTQLIKEIVTDEYGDAVSDLLPIDNYYIKECKAPTGYLLSDEVLAISAEEMAQGFSTDLMVKREMTDMPVRGGLILMKYLDKNINTSELQNMYESGELEGIEFELQHEDSAVPAVTIKTDRQGYASTGDHALLYGTWYITEKNVPEGYSGLRAASVTIRQDGVMEKYVVSNSQISQYIRIVKKDSVNGKNIKRDGAVFSIMDSQGKLLEMPDNADFGKLVTEFHTNSDGELMLTKPLQAGSYFLQEIQAPKGFALAEPIPFTVTEDASYEEPRELICEDRPLTGKLLITKVDEQGNRLGEGFVFSVTVAADILDEDGELRTMMINGEETALSAGTVIGKIETDTQGIASMDHLYLGIYEVRECGSAQYYASDPMPYQVVISEQENSEPIIADIQLENKKTTVNIIKVDAVETEKPLEGVHYRVIRADQLKQENAEPQLGVNTVEANAAVANAAEESEIHPEEALQREGIGTEYITDANGKIHITDLAHRMTYYVYETQTLPGYHLDTEMYSFYVDADGLINGRAVYEMKFSNVANMVEISKQDITGDGELPGAELIIHDADGNEVDRWISQEEPHKMKGLTAGTYRLTENQAPVGYATAETISFELNDSMQVQQVTMYDKQLETSISKKDMTNDHELPGASLTIKDKDGKTVEEWISTDVPHMVSLPAGDYTLTEVTAPKGYATAETIRFTVNDLMEVQPVVMYDAPLMVSISKRDITTEKELPGATLTIRDSSGKEVETWVSKPEPHMVQLEKGDYTLTEITAPKGYKTAETISFTVKDQMEVQKVVMYDSAIEESEKESDGLPHGSSMQGGQVGKTGIRDHFRLLIAIIAGCMIVGGISFLIYLLLGKDA